MSNNPEGNDESGLDVAAAAPADEPKKKQCCDIYEGCAMAQGYSWLGATRGMIIMSNIVFNVAIISLASVAAGCDAQATAGNPCTNKIWGFTPSALISNTQVYAGIGAALFLPVAGAIIDTTPYRRTLGVVTAALITIIQAVQIGLSQSTWGPMYILQSISAVLYLVQVAPAYAYLPEIAKEKGHEKTTRFTSSFQAFQFGFQALFLVVIAIVGIGLGSRNSSVLTARISQGINTLGCLVAFSVGWFYYMPSRPAIRKRSEGKTAVGEGFSKVALTAKKVFTFKKGLRWYFLSLLFAESATTTLTTVSTIILSNYGFNATQTSVFFLVVLLSSLPGSIVAANFVTLRTNPNTSWKLSMLYLFVTLVTGSLLFNVIAKETALANPENLLNQWGFQVWGIFIGIGLGWFYPTENLIFALTIKGGVGTELAGFHTFCAQVFSWCPPLIFSAMNEAGIHQGYSLIAVVSFYIIAIALMSCTGTWDEFVAEAKEGLEMFSEEKGDSETGQVAEPSSSASKDVKE